MTGSRIGREVGGGGGINSGPLTAPLVSVVFTTRAHRNYKMQHAKRKGVA
jgi:hypothetical protein